MKTPPSFTKMDMMDLERSIFDISREGSVDLETLENLSMEEEHAEFSHDQLEPYMCISTENIEKQYHEELDMMQLTKDQSHPSSSHIEVPYDLEQQRAYTMSYHSVSLDDHYDDIGSPPHHVDWYISPFQSWIETACMSTYQFGKNFYDIIHAYDSHLACPFRVITQVCIF